MHAYSQLATVMTTMAIEHSIIGAGILPALIDTSQQVYK